VQIALPGGLRVLGMKYSTGPLEFYPDEEADQSQFWWRIEKLSPVHNHHGIDGGLW